MNLPGKLLAPKKYLSDWIANRMKWGNLSIFRASISVKVDREVRLVMIDTLPNVYGCLANELDDMFRGRAGQ